MSATGAASEGMGDLPWPVHPAAQLFPLIGGQELAELADDIGANGLNEPVWLCDDPGEGRMLLDGRNRCLACDIAGVAIRIRIYTGEDPVTFSISQNMKRRHLTTGQRAAVGAAAEQLYAEQARRRQEEAGKEFGRGHPKDPNKKLPADPREAISGAVPAKRARESAEKAAKAAGTSGRAVSQFKRIEKVAPDLAEKVKAGQMALDRAERIVRDREAEAEWFRQAYERSKRSPIPLRVDIRHGDFREVLRDLADVDAVITDPPYGFEFLPLLADLATWADKVLTPNGVLAVLIGQTHLPEVFRLLDGHRPYRWTVCYLTTGPGYVSHYREVQSQWKPLLVYGGGPRFSDVVTSKGDVGAKDAHKWGQNYQAFHTIVESLTSPGQTVADPFAGSGTTLLAAHALGRHAVGCDIDAECVAKTRERIG